MHKKHYIFNNENKSFHSLNGIGLQLKVIVIVVEIVILKLWLTAVHPDGGLNEGGGIVVQES